MRILHVVPSLTIGGAEVFATTLAARQAAAGHDVHLLCMRASGPLFERLPPSLRSRTHVLRSRARFDPRLALRAATAVEAVRPDVIHTHLFTSLAWISAAKRLGAPGALVHTQHATHVEPERLSRAVDRALCRRVDHLICVSPAAAEAMRARGSLPARWSVIPNGIDLDGRPRATLQGEPPVFGTAGRLDPIKGHRFLIDAVAELRDEGTAVRLVICGGGPLEAALRAQIEGLNLGDRVTLTGAVSDVAQRLAGFDAFVLPSLKEALPMALLEAGAAGLPLIVTAEGGARILLDEGAGGYVVAPGDAPALAFAMRSLVHAGPDARLALGEKSFALVSTRYTLDATLAAHEAVYREVVAGSRAR